MTLCWVMRWNKCCTILCACIAVHETTLRLNTQSPHSLHCKVKEETLWTQNCFISMLKVSCKTNKGFYFRCKSFLRCTYADWFKFNRRKSHLNIRFNQQRYKSGRTQTKPIQLRRKTHNVDLMRFNSIYWWWRTN